MGFDSINIFGGIWRDIVGYRGIFGIQRRGLQPPERRASSRPPCRAPLTLVLHGATLARPARAVYRTMVRGIARACKVAGADRQGHARRDAMQAVTAVRNPG